MQAGSRKFDNCGQFFVFYLVIYFHFWPCCNQVQCAIDELRESAASRTNKLQQEMSIMQKTTSSIKEEWASCSERAASHYLENTALVESGKEEMRDVILKWLASTTLFVFLGNTG